MDLVIFNWFRIACWLARVPAWSFYRRKPEPHDWYGTIIRLRRLVIWIVLRREPQREQKIP